MVRVTVKALGDYTSHLQELIQPGMPAVLGGPHGRFSHWRGTDRQLWIAGGVGVAPFISWLRGLDGELPHHASSTNWCARESRLGVFTAITSTGAEPRTVTS